MFPSLLHWLCVLGKCNRKPEIISLWREWKSVRHFPSWVWVDKRVTNDPVEPHRSALRRWRRGGGRAGGGVGRKSDVTPSFIHPSTPVATATWPRGTQERRHGWQKQHSGRKWLRANESKLDRRECEGEPREGRSSGQSTPDSGPRSAQSHQRGFDLQAPGQEV